MPRQSGASEGGIGEITSADTTVDITGSTGPVTDLSVTTTASEIAYTGIAPSTETTVEGELDWRARQTGSYATVSNYADLLTVFGPLVGSTLVVDQGVLMTAFDGVPAGVDIQIVVPGFISSIGSTSVAIIGNVASPLIWGDTTISRIAILNVNPGGSDMELDTLSSGIIRITECALLGQGGFEIKNAGDVALSQIAFQPSSGGAKGLTISGTIGAFLFANMLFQAPGGSDYTGIEIAATAVALSLIIASELSFVAIRADDAMWNISPSATLPGSGAPPVFAAGLRIIAPNIRDPSGAGGIGRLFAAGSLTEDDLPVAVSNGQNAPSSRLIGDAFIDLAGGTLIPLSFAAVPIGNTVVVPASNGVGGILTLQPLSSHFTLDVTDPLAWFLRYDGPDSERNAGILWAFDFIKNGAANSITGIVEVDTGGGFAPLPESESTPKLATTTIPARAEGRAPVLMNSGDKIRIVASSDGTSAIDISRILLIEEQVG